MKTNQEIFTQVADHLMEQDQRAWDATTSAYAYRTADGLRSAVGCLIPDELYHEDLEGITICDIIRPGSGAELLTSTLLASGIPATVEVRDLLIDLTFIHDHREPIMWPDDLSKLARSYGLTVPESVKRRVSWPPLKAQVGQNV